MENIEEEVIKHGKEIELMSRRLDNLEKLTESVQKLAISVDRTVNKQAGMEEQLKQIAADIREQKDKPNKRWETLISCVITAVVTALITLLLKGEI